MIVACATDRNYAELTGVMIASCVAESALPRISFLVMSTGLRAADKRNIKLCAGRHRIVFVDSRRPLARVRHLPSHQWPHETFARIVIPDMLPPVGRLLYLDCDIIINGSLQELQSLDLHDFAFAAVPSTAQEQERIGIPVSKPYFNAGVLLINLQKWKEKQITQKALDWATAHPLLLKYPDQDALNAAAHGEYKHLPHVYNFEKGRHGDASDEEISSAKIVHFTGTRKPNAASCPHSGRKLYLFHRSRTIWGTRPLVSESQLRRKMVLAILRRRLLRLSKLWSTFAPT